MWYLCLEKKLKKWGFKIRLGYPKERGVSKIRIKLNKNGHE